jgi:CRP/FNR family transcriptional regulator, cyclic AMP receptor protein
MAPVAVRSLNAVEQRAIAASNLGDLPPEIVATLTAGAQRLIVPAGSTIHDEGENFPHVELVVAGLVRVRVTAPDGRTMTIRYCRPGALIGVVTLYAADWERPFGVQALVESELLGLRPEIVRGFADRDLRVAKALLTETSERVASFVSAISGNAFAPVRQRVARHLLDLASDQQRGSDLIVPISQQELADAVGTVREVVVRILRELREEGVLQTARDRITIQRPERLVSSIDSVPPARPPRSGTNVPDN